MSEELVQQEIVEQTQQPQQKLYNDEQVNALIGRKKAEAAEKARREVEEQYRQEIESLKANQNKGIDYDAITETVAKKFERQLQEREEQNKRAQFEAHVKDVAGKFNTRMASFTPSEDFEDVLQITTHPQKHPEIIFLATDDSLVDDTQEFIKELAKSPSKARELKEWFREDPDIARSMAKKFAKSIKANKEALQNKPSINSPLSQLKTSSVGSGGGKMGLADFKKANWLRG